MRPDDILVEIRDGDLNRVAQIGPEDLLSATFAPSMFGGGVWQIRLPHLIVDQTTNRPVTNPKALLLQTPGNGVVVTTPGGVYLSGNLSQPDLQVSAEFPGGVWVLDGVSDATTVTEVDVWGAPASPLASQVGAVDAKTDEAESLLYWYANRNRGPGAAVARRDSFLTMAADLARGPVLKKAPIPFQPMSDLFAEIVREAYAATGIRLNYDVVQVGAGLKFRVLVAQDRTAEIRFDFEHGLLDEVSYRRSAPQATDVVAGGAGVLRSKSLPSNPWGFRRERYIDASTSDTTELDQAIDAALVEAQEDSVSFSAVATDDAGRIPGVDYNVGDLVTVVVPGVPNDIEIPVPVTGTLIHMTPDGVTAGMVLGSPTGNSWQDLQTLRTQRLTGRVSRLERK